MNNKRKLTLVYTIRFDKYYLMVDDVTDVRDPFIRDKEYTFNGRVDKCDGSLWVPPDILKNVNMLIIGRGTYPPDKSGLIYLDQNDLVLKVNRKQFTDIKILVLTYNQLHTNNTVTEDDILVKNNGIYKKYRESFKFKHSPSGLVIFDMMYDILSYDII